MIIPPPRDCNTKVLHRMSNRSGRKTLAGAMPTEAGTSQSRRRHCMLHRIARYAEVYCSIAIAEAPVNHICKEQ